MDEGRGTRDLLDKPTGGVTNTMDKVSFGTLLTDDPGGGNLHAGLWWTNMDYAIRSPVRLSPRLPRRRESKRHLFVVDSFDKHMQNEKELIRLRRELPEPGARNFACGPKYLAPGWFNFACGANYPHHNYTRH